MKGEIIARIIGSLDNCTSVFEDDKPKFSRPGYNARAISPENFKEIRSKDIRKQIAFVDGGNAEILKAANFSLQFIRTYGCIFRNNKRMGSIKNEFYVLIKAVGEDDIRYEAEFFPVTGDILVSRDSLRFDSNDQTIRTGISRADISVIGDIARKFSELMLADKLVGLLGKGDIIVLDGTLQCSVTNQEKYFERLYGSGLEKGVFICALAKSTSLMTEKGNSLAAAMLALSPECAWYYHPLVAISDPKHKAEMFFIRLHKNSEYAFRFELYNKQRFDEDILSALKSNSADSAFPGYPYGLITADKFARVSNEEQEFLKTMFRTKAAAGWKKIRRYTANVDAHDILDNVS